MVTHSKTPTNSNKTRWISTLLQAFKTKSNKGLKRTDVSTRGKIYIFHSFKTLESGILKQLEIKTVGGHSGFQKLQIDKQKTHTYLKLCNYQDCQIS